MNPAMRNTRTNEGSLFRTIFLIAGLGTLIVSTNFLDPINLPKLIAILIPAPWLMLYLVRSLNLETSLRSFVKDRVQFMFLVAIASLFLILIFSPAPIERRFVGTWGRNNGLIVSIMSILLAWGAYELANRRMSTIKFLNATLVLLIPTAIYGLIQISNNDPIPWSSGTMKIFATFGNTNFASAAWALGSIVSLTLLIFNIPMQKKSNQNLKFAYIFSFLLFGYLAYMTKSIQGPFAIFVFIVLVSILKLWSIKNLAAKSLSLLLTTLGAVIAHSLFFNGPLTNLISNAGSLGFRKIYWNIGINMFSQHPFFGVGVDSYGDYYRSVRDSKMATTTSIDLVVNNAHNTFIQTLATLGFFGFLSLILPVIATFVLGLVKILKSRAFNLSVVIFCIFVTLWLIAAFSIDNISITLWNWVFLGFTLGLFNDLIEIKNSTAEKSKSRIKKFASTRQNYELYDLGRVIAFVASVSLAIILWQISSPDRVILRAKSLPTDFSQPQIINSKLTTLGDISFSTNLDPQHYLAIATSLVELQQIPQSSEVLGRGVQKYPRDFALLDYLAFTLEKQGRISEAISAREKQLELDPRHARVWSYLAQDYLQNNQLFEAKAAAAKAISNLSIFAPDDQNKIKNFLEQLNLG